MRNRMLLDIDSLTYGLGVWVQNQDLVICGDNGNPAVAKGHGLGCGACGQDDFCWQAWAIGRQADDKQADNHYKPANHHHG